MIPSRLTGERLPMVMLLDYLEQGGPAASTFAIGTQTVEDAMRHVLGNTLLEGLGVAVLRGPAGEKSPELAINYKPTGKVAGHMHVDTLGLHWQSPNHRWASASGKWAGYGSDVHRGWVIQSLSDNLVVVDRTSQSPLGGSTNAWVNDEPGDLSYGVLKAFTAGATFGYTHVASDRINRGVTHQRRLFNTDAYTLDVYRVTSDRHRVYDWVLHVDGVLSDSSAPLSRHSEPLSDKAGYDFLEQLQIGEAADAWTTWWRKDGIDERLSVTTLGSSGTSVYTARGPWSSDDRGAKLVSREGETAKFVSLLHPYESDEGAKPTMHWLGEADFEEHPAAGALHVSKGQTEDYYAWHEQMTAGQVGPISYEGEAVMARVASTGRVQDATLVGGTRFEAEGLSFSTESPATLSVQVVEPSKLLIVFDDAYPMPLRLQAGFDVEVAAYRLSGEGELKDRVSVEMDGDAAVLHAEPYTNYLLVPSDREAIDIEVPAVMKVFSRD